jgi:hypothetical protein
VVAFRSSAVAEAPGAMAGATTDVGKALGLGNGSEHTQCMYVE